MADDKPAGGVSKRAWWQAINIGGLIYGDPANEVPELARYRYGQRIIWWGFFLIGAVTFAAIWRYDDPGKAAIVISTVTGVVGTIIGAFFGIAAGSAGRDQSEAITRHLLANNSPDASNAALARSGQPAPTAAPSVDKVD